MDDTSYIYESCTLCPRGCRVDRRKARGFCGQSDAVRVARYQKHMWEEPCISGSRGSGTVFFSGCTLKCVFCQNYEVSRGMGTDISAERLAGIFMELKEQRVHNISLVTGTHFIPGIKKALDICGDRLDLPVVFNCGGYEDAGVMRQLEKYVDIYIPDLKYKDPAMSLRYSSCADYYDRAIEGIGEMLRQVPRVQLDGDGVMRRGIIIRHLVLPGGYRDSISILEGIAQNFGTKGFLLSLMSQYTPMPSCAAYPEINRRITTLEYRRVSERALELGFDGYFQERSSSNETYIPPFGENDVKPG